jgi:hypothetical protein
MGERRCRKHEPEWRSDNLLDQLAGKVRCKNCGMDGCLSNGQRRFGRPRRVIWFRRAFDRTTPTQQQQETGNGERE